MCDTFVATGKSTLDGVTVFAKNSDRDPNEAQYLTAVPAMDHPAGATLECTYINIPQAGHTHAVLLSRPFWMWGAEMGVNAHGVAIGNEAVFSRVPAGRRKTLIGMDLLRLGLERADTARGALEVITSLLAEFGQGGNCGYARKLYYHNSFIIADPHEAWVLETVDRHWAAEKVDGIRTISNGLTIDGKWDAASPDLVSYAMDKRWCVEHDDFSFNACYSDKVYTRFSDSRSRCRRTRELLEAEEGKIGVHTAARILRDHHAAGAGQRPPDRGITGASVCMHAGFGPVRGSQTTGSMICHLHPGKPAHFFTGTAAPCTGIFKPLWSDTAVPGTGRIPTGKCDDTSLFWRHERLHRETLEDFNFRLSRYQGDRDALEQSFIERALQVAGGTREERAAFSRDCFEKAAQSEKDWLNRIRQQPPGTKRPCLYRKAWQQINRQAVFE